jgi:hypothetical protein
MIASAARNVSTGRQLDSIFIGGFLSRRNRVGYLHTDAYAYQFSEDVDHLRIANIGNVFLERHTEDRHCWIGAAPLQQRSHTFPRNAFTHAVIDASAGKDNLRVIACLFGAFDALAI